MPAPGLAARMQTHAHGIVQAFRPTFAGRSFESRGWNCKGCGREQAHSWRRRSLTSKFVYALDGLRSLPTRVIGHGVGGSPRTAVGTGQVV